ncbi:MAG: DMT family protein [Planctomycetaceae bacterium]
MLTIVLLTISNLFMTFAWYGHLKFKSAPLWIAILVSWGIAFVEYCFQVPANRYGHAHWSASQLKVIQEVITLIIFGGFTIFYLKESPRWNELVGFALILLAVAFVFGFPQEKNPHTPLDTVPPTHNHTPS